MQSIKTFVRCKSTKGTVVDQYNNASNDRAELTLYTASSLNISLFKTDEPDSQYTTAELNGYSWKLFCDGDYDATSSPKIAVTSGITVASNSISVPIETTSATLIAWLGTAESKTIHAELQGYTNVSDTNPDFVCQFDIVIRNRIFYAGNGTSIDLTALVGGQSLMTIETAGANKIFRITMATDATKYISFICNGSTISAITATDGTNTFTM